MAWCTGVLASVPLGKLPRERNAEKALWSFWRWNDQGISGISLQSRAVTNWQLKDSGGGVGAEET